MKRKKCKASESRAKCAGYVGTFVPQLGCPDCERMKMKRKDRVRVFNAWLDSQIFLTRAGTVTETLRMVKAKAKEIGLR